MVKMVKEKKFQELFQYDQLTKERKAGRVFATFTEGDYTTFEPTFKVVKGAAELTYNEERSPAWCDRVLWRSNTPDAIECKGPWNSLKVNSSDHKPVGISLNVPVYNKPCVATESKKKLVITFDEVKGVNLPPMDTNGLCDAYLEFISQELPFSKKRIYSGVIKKNLNPTFKKVPKLEAIVSNPARMAHGILTILLWDNDLLKKDHKIGYATMAMHPFVPTGGAASKSTSFSLPIVLGGVHMNNGKAMLEGKVTVTVA
eukprot:CAMPEP_0170180520 /NCGR_PEP_ID=MMETSP0040_2-20121228/22144_1 /TAXON_ID=641309 /ORGANISM="Lotharella oceanica, Strain CCMP622" /LENGTH=257 /DNA_ID=CAMNT_0010425181 /DNA_START=9 /DNA_END=782 /DNA_ORIENTATION=+